MSKLTAAEKKAKAAAKEAEKKAKAAAEKKGNAISHNESANNGVYRTC